MRRIGLTYRIALAVTVLLSLSAGLIGWILYLNLGGLMQRLESRTLSGLAGMEARLIEDKAMEELRRDALILARSRQIQRLMSMPGAGPESAESVTVQAQLSALLEAAPNYLRVRVIGIDEGGRERLRLEHDAASDLIRSVASEDMDFSAEESVYRIGANLAPGKVYLSEVRLARRAGQVVRPYIPIIQGAAAIRDDQHSLLGVIVLELDMRQISADFVDAAGPGVSLYMFNDRGYCLMAPPGKPCAFGFEFPGEGASPEMAHYLPSLAHLLAHESQERFTIKDMQDSVTPVSVGVVRKRLGFAGDFRYLVMAVVAPHESALAGPKAAKATILTVLFILFPIAMIGSWFVARSVTRPLRDLTESVEAFASGHGDHGTLPVKARDELGALARAFVAMRGQVRERTGMEADERARSMVELAATGICGVDAAGQFSFVNPAARHLLGLTDQEALSVSPVRFFCIAHDPGELEADAHNCAFAQALREGKSLQVDDAEFRRYDGVTFPVRFSAVPLMNDGACEGLVVTFEDRSHELAARRSLIRARQQAENSAIQAGVMAQLLRLSLRRTPMEDYLTAALMTLLTSLPWLSLKPKGGILLTEDEGRGRALRMAAEHNLDEPLTRNCMRVEFGTCLCGRAAESKVIQFAEHIDHRHEIMFDSMEPHGHYNVPIIEDGMVLGVLVLYLAEGYREEGGERMFLEKVADILSMGIGARYSSRALSRAKDAAEGAVRAKSEFLATMSHEIRTPMNGILGMAQLLGETELDAEQHDFVHVIEQSGAALLTVINDILDFSKIEAGRMSVDPIPFDLERAVHDVVRLLQPKAAEKDIEVAVSYDPACPTRLVGDAGRMRQVLLNLVGNAIKFTEHGHVLIDVGQVGQKLDGSVRLRVQVRDTGIGISADARERLFNAFTQADSSTTRKYGGTGLGLAISKKLIDLMGGEIGVDSQPGSGSTFWFTLDLPVADSPVDMPMADLAGRRLLIVDDLADNQRIIDGLARHWGMHTTLASSGEEALNALRQASLDEQPYDLAIVDFFMPEMDGEALIRAIRATPIESIARLPVVLLSSSGERGDAKVFAAMGFNGYLAKPVQSQAMHAVLAAVLGRRAEEPNGSDEAIVTRHMVAEASPGVVCDDSLHARILLVEDVAANRKIALAMLARIGIEADVATDGAEALAMYRAQRYPLILMDCQMPVMDGYEATRRIRDLETAEGLARVPIIALTAHNLGGERQRCLDAGMDDFMSKPFKRTELAELLRNWLQSGERTADMAHARVGAPRGQGVPEELATLDASVIEAMRRDYPEDFHELIGSFHQSVEEILVGLSSGLDATDVDSLARLAHSLKSSAGAFGATRLESMAQELEALAHQGMTAQLADRVAALRLEYEHVGAALRDLVSAD